MLWSLSSFLILFNQRKEDFELSEFVFYIESSSSQQQIKTVENKSG